MIIVTIINNKYFLLQHIYENSWYFPSLEKKRKYPFTAMI